MKPSEYKVRYETIGLPSNPKAAIKVHQYRATWITAGAGKFNDKAWGAVDSHFFDLKDKKASDFGLQVDRGSGFQSVDPKLMLFADIRPKVQLAYIGKGSPEHCQLALQLVELWKLAPKGLQAYADDALGLDCNGFVGNYVFHDRRGNPWTSLGLKDGEGPDNQIPEFTTKNSIEIGTWSDMKPGSSYLFIKTDELGSMIKGGGANPGHIAVTDPDNFRLATAATPAGVWVSESTMAYLPGLCSGYYSLKNMSAKATRPVFYVFREGKLAGHTEFYFRIFKLA